MAKQKIANPETCERCPHRFDAAGCPCWIGPQAGFLEMNAATGAERFITGCFYQVIPRLMVEVIKASNRPAAAVEGMRNEVFRALQHAMLDAPRPPAEPPAIGNGATPMLEHNG